MNINDYCPGWGFERPHRPNTTTNYTRTFSKSPFVNISVLYLCCFENVCSVPFVSKTLWTSIHECYIMYYSIMPCLIQLYHVLYHVLFNYTMHYTKYYLTIPSIIPCIDHVSTTYYYIILRITPCIIGSYRVLYYVLCDCSMYYTKYYWIIHCIIHWLFAYDKYYKYVLFDPTMYYTMYRY